MKPDALLPFAIAAIMGFLALGWADGPEDGDAAKVRSRIQLGARITDHEVKALEDSADLRGTLVEEVADAPGKWRVVNSFSDDKIRLVDSLPEIMIQDARSLPGPSS